MLDTNRRTRGTDRIVILAISIVVPFVVAACLATPAFSQRDVVAFDNAGTVLAAACFVTVRGGL